MSKLTFCTIFFPTSFHYESFKVFLMQISLGKKNYVDKYPLQNMDILRLSNGILFKDKRFFFPYFLSLNAIYFKSIMSQIFE
jgi:hypothetical protein